MAQITWTSEAESWLREIYEYIAQDNPNAALNVVTAIYRRTETLLRFPKAGHQYRKTPEGDIRVLLYGHYRIAYLLKKGESIDILGVFHDAMEIERYLP